MYTSMPVKAILLMFTLLMAVSGRAADMDRMSLSGRRISSVDGLSGNTVYDMTQDRDGFLWMGASYGLCRYDGYSFLNYYSLSSDKSKKMDAITGNLYMDSLNNHLWIHTSTFSFACYDLRAGRFTDYTGRGDEGRPYRRFLRSGNDMWMYDTRSGIRHVTYDGGRFTCRDYNTASGNLPSDHVPRMLEDGRRGVWALTGGGLLRMERDGSVRAVVKGRKYIAGNVYKGNIVCLSEDNVIEMFAPDGRRLRRTVVPAVLGRLKTIRSNFVWQDRWMVFSGETYCLDLKTFEVSKPEEYQVSNGLLLDAIDGYFFESNNTGRLWIFPPEGEMRMLSLLPDMKFTAERQRKYNVRRGRDGLFYIASYGNGLFIYDHATGALRHFSARDAQAVIDNDYLTNLFIDAGGNVWVAQEQAGVSRIAVSRQAVAEFLLPVPGKLGDWSNFIRMVAPDGDGRVLLSTKDNHLYSLDLAAGRITPAGETRSCVFGYLTDRAGRTWMATRGDGLYVDGVRYSKYDRERHVPTNNFYDIKEDRYGRIWLASYEEGLIMMKPEAGGRIAVRQYLYRSINEGRQHQLELDGDGWLWIASSNGLYAVDTKKKDIGNGDFKSFNTSAGNFPIDEMRCVRVAGGMLWAGGKGSGVVRCRITGGHGLADIVNVTVAEGLADNSVSSIVADRYGSVWAATEEGLSRINRKDLKVKTYKFGNRLERNTYSEGCAMSLPDGRLLFGTRYGLTVVTPARSYTESKAGPLSLRITGMTVNGRPADEAGVADRAVHYSDEISLAHNENTIALSFSNFEYADIESSLYQYYLEGLENTWRPLTSVNHVEYGNLPPGRYVFHIRSLSGSRRSAEKSLTVTVRHPWYATWQAWAVYLLALSALGLYLYNNARERLRLHQQMRIEKELTEFRLRFFTNITHEFRTPLAIIQGAVDKLQADGGRPSRSAVQTARRGTRRLMRLVNMLMEFRKVNTGNMRLNVEQGDIVAFVKDIFHDFWTVAKQKDMSMVFTPFARAFDVPFDRQMVETMVYNLISNAIKYTPERGRVAVAMRRSDAGIEISVEDSGPGVGPEQAARLFQPFMNGYASSGGMGIGLYTAHRMAALHKGSLTYRRAGEAGGSVFTVTLPADAAAYSADDYAKATAVARPSDEAADAGCEEVIRELRPEAINDVCVAVIEDDPDMAEQICSEIGVYFKVKSYSTGQAGVEGVCGSAPSLVVCDVMLPDMSGYDVVKALKGGASTADIPVIMLTALDDEAHQLKSYGAGADDYMVKPCNFRLLVARAMQLINRARAVRERPSASSPAAGAASKPLLTSAADKNLMDRIGMIVAQHIGDKDFTVDKLAEALGMGRTKMFAKMKELTGVSPNKYLQNERLRIAAGLLAEGRFTVAEVSYKVGIQDASYFNKCFKARYGVVPSKYGHAQEKGE